jgi:tRNA1(Val) A37 N6-methylase TrmN6
MQPAMAELAAENARANGFAGIEIMTDRIETASFTQMFDHAMANPPYHHAGGSVSPDAGRETAKRGSGALMQCWIERLSAALHSRGTLTLIAPAGMVPVCLAAMSASRCACMAIFPLWPKTERPAKLVLLRGVKDTRAPMQLMPGLVLHRPDGSFSDAARAVLAEAAALAVAG